MATIDEVFEQNKKILNMLAGILDEVEYIRSEQQRQKEDNNGKEKNNS